MSAKEETMYAIANRRRLRGLTLRFAALIALAVPSIAVMGVGASSAWGASSYRVLECYPGDGVSTAPDLSEAGADGSVIRFGEDCSVPTYDGWHKGIVFDPYTSSGGPVAATAQFVAPPGTYFGAGAFHVDIGARYTGCSANACYYAAAYAGNGSTPYWSYPMSTSPYAAAPTWNNCGGCTRIWEDINCSSFCVHFASDPGGNANDFYYDYVSIRDIDVTLVDGSVPNLTLSGSLFDSQIAHGQPNLQIDATDVGGGVRTATVQVNGVSVASPQGPCPGISAGAPWGTRFRPCGNLSTSVPLDTAKTPWQDGNNALRVCVSDVSTGPGDANTACEQRTISVDNSCPDSQGASGEAQAINAGLEDPRTGQLSRTRAVRSSDGTGLRGQLVGNGGAPVKAASVCIYETVDEPAGIEQLVQVAKSSSTGSFGVEIPGGPTRTFRAAYRYNGRQIETASMYLDSSVLPTLELTKSKLRNGKAVGFRGHIPGPNNNARGVTMQAKVGKKWRSFKQIETDASGNFRGKYRFTQTRGRAIYLFRALVKKQGGYPYSEGASAKRKVLVRG